MQNLSSGVFALFILTVGLTIWLFFRATHYAKIPMILVLFLTVVQSILGLSTFYLDSKALPPRFVFLIMPSFIMIVIALLLPSLKKFIDSMSLERLTILHTIRIPVEIVLYYLFLASLIPKSMTFEGTNFDILSGISAPVIFYLVFKMKVLPQKLLLFWNFACLGLLINIVGTAILSAQTPFQMFAFEQPNVGVAYFPFLLLPSIIVPIVLFSHLVAIRKLWNA